MLFSYAGTALAAGGVSSPAYDVSINGRQLNQRVDLARSAIAQFIPRGNRSTTIRFKVSLTFDTVAEAEFFALTQFANLPPSGDLVVTCGGEGGTTASATLPGAVLDEVPIPKIEGVSIVIAYAFSGGVFVAGDTSEDGDAILDSSGNPVLDNLGSALLAA